MPDLTEWVAVDWGTSNLRAWGMGVGGQAFFAASDRGMGRLTQASFPACSPHCLPIICRRTPRRSTC